MGFSEWALALNLSEYCLPHIEGVALLTLDPEVESYEGSRSKIGPPFSTEIRGADRSGLRSWCWEGERGQECLRCQFRPSGLKAAATFLEKHGPIVQSQPPPSPQSQGNLKFEISDFAGWPVKVCAPASIVIAPSADSSRFSSRNYLGAAAVFRASAWTAVMAVTVTMSSGEHPRERSLAGLLSP